MTKLIDYYAVFGNPIEHSKSPEIHMNFADLTGEAVLYEKQLVDVDNFENAATEFFKKGKGLNITVPFKLEAYSFAARLTERARRAGAVNTLAMQDDGTILGDNTDGIGMVSDIVDNLGWIVKNKKVLILGAGGAVRGILQPLLGQNPKALVIANRTVEKAKQLAKGFSELGSVEGCGFEHLSDFKFDIVINGTSASLAGDLPPLPDTLLAKGACCYDMMYGAEPTVFMHWAKEHGATAVADGLGMLVGQAAESFKLWRGVKPEVQSVIEKQRAKLK